MNGYPGFRDFYARWRRSLEEVSKRPAPTKHDLWEGVEAYDELKRSEAIILVVPLWEDMDIPSTTLLQQIWTEVETYQRLADQVVSQNAQFRDVMDFLKGAVKHCEKVEGRTNVSRLRNVLRPLRLRLTTDREKVEEIRKSYWTRALREYRLPQDDRITIEFNEQTGECFTAAPASLPPDIHSLEEIQAKSIDEGPPTRKMDFDGRFQRRLGRVLRHWVPGGTGVRLRTISRLIALIYLSANFAEEGDVLVRDRRTGKRRKQLALVIRNTGRSLSLGGIDQNLLDIGLS
jgi:hypothetical protein